MTQKHVFPIFSSKSNVLKFLQTKVSRSRIEKIYDFTVTEWKKDPHRIIQGIKNNFKQEIIIRSSALGEDSLESSQAGTYESVLNVNPRSAKQITKAIDAVIGSYNQKTNSNQDNQVLVQSQARNIVLSGVIFTKTADIGAPYYVVNFEEGESTVGVTKGIAGNTVKISRAINEDCIPKQWKRLIIAVKELERVLKSDLLDIEFGITRSESIRVFQVRPMTFVKNTSKNSNDKKNSSLIKKNQKKFSKLNRRKHVPGDHTIFSDMCDWNPAEIIGNNPNLLDYSLYDFLIMKNAWHKGRKFLNYYDIDPYPLMAKFGNKPYVDVRASFNSLVPKQIDSRLRKKLVGFYLKKLERFPFLHDKVEFEILFSCYDFTIDSRLKELTKHNFSLKEISTIKRSLQEFTNQVIFDFPRISECCKNSILELEKGRLKLLSESASSTSYEKLEKAEKLLKNCKELGAIPFSTMARIAFIASILLKSLQRSGLIRASFVDDFMNSISTPLSEIQKDILDYGKKKISKKDFLEKYGHLRPGTYDILAKRYDTDDQVLHVIGFADKKDKQRSLRLESKVDRILSEHGLIFQSVGFSSFIKTSIMQREQLKFEFTKSLSDSIELIAKAGLELGFSREELSNLSLSSIFKYRKLPKEKLVDLWRKKIRLQKEEKSKNSNLSLPPLLFSERDFEVLQYYISKPNFITNKKITGQLTTLSSGDKDAVANRIILIENADPGYDWIFTKNPLALVTKYGGVASHMAIRCAEIGLPAAIGCGEIMYEQLLNSSKILLDCKSQEILILEHYKKNEEIEARKILKSLGYIK